MNQSRSENRKLMPFCAECVDDARKYFGDGITVRYVKENSVEKGSQGDEGVMASVGVK
jgi:hypothetical protein